MNFCRCRQSPRRTRARAGIVTPRCAVTLPLCARPTIVHSLAPLESHVVEGFLLQLRQLRLLWGAALLIQTGHTGWRQTCQLFAGLTQAFGKHIADRRGVLAHRQFEKLHVFCASTELNLGVLLRDRERADSCPVGSTGSFAGEVREGAIKEMIPAPGLSDRTLLLVPCCIRDLGGHGPRRAIIKPLQPRNPASRRGGSRHT
jgi:hypothetical protein